MHANEPRVFAGVFGLRDGVFETSEFAILTMDRGGRITGWSVGASRLFGYTENEAIGLPGAALFTPDDAAAGVPEREIGRALSLGRSKDERWHLRKPDDADGRRRRNESSAEDSS